MNLEMQLDGILMDNTGNKDQNSQLIVFIPKLFPNKEDKLNLQIWFKGITWSKENILNY